jgi:hypothetical protein
MPEARERARRWAAPVLLAALAAASWSVYRAAPGRVADVAAVPYALALGLGPGLAWAGVRARGGAARAAAAGAGLVPGLWLAKELWRTSAVHPLAETLFYALNPVCLGYLALVLLECALAELALRRLREGRGAPMRGPASLAGALLAAGAALAWLLRDDRAPVVFYAYVDLYRAIFAP